VADLFYRYGFAKEAEETYRAVVARAPRQPEGPLALSIFLARQDRVSEAMEILKKAWDTFPLARERVAYSSLALYSAPSATDKDRSQVESWCVQATQGKSDALLLSAKLGVIWIDRGRFGQAETIFRRVLSSQPDNVEALNDLAWLLSLRRDEPNLSEALELINSAIGVAGPASSLIDTRAVVQIRSGKLAEAVTELTQARAREPKDASLARHLAWAFQIQGKKDQAREALRQARDLGWKVEKCDPLERPFMEKLQGQLLH
jgi:tetratricopeptide (TPR) repeat protein